jgi:putative flippase GtrA
VFFIQIPKGLIIKFIKFGLVGLSGVFVDFGFTYICKEWIKLNKYLSNSIGFCIAASSNYFLNRVWTFHSQNPEIGREFSEFFLISIIGLGINNSVLYVMINRFKLNFYISKLFAIAVTTLWNFFANYLYTFAH